MYWQTRTDYDILCTDGKADDSDTECNVCNKYFHQGYLNIWQSQKRIIFWILISRGKT